MINYVQLIIGDIVFKSYRFKHLGSEGHKKALDKAKSDFLYWMGDDLEDQFAKYLKLKFEVDNGKRI